MNDNSQKKTRREAVELIIFIVMAIVFAYGINTGISGYSGSRTAFVVVETGSMQPTLVGIYVFDEETYTTHWSPITADMLFIKKISPRDLILGDIIVFEDPRGGDIPIVHRIVEKYEHDGIYYFRTTGDNPWTNDQVDWWEISQDQVIGKVLTRIPRIGYLQLSLQTSLGRLLLLLAIIILIVSMFFSKVELEESQPSEKKMELPSSPVAVTPSQPMRVGGDKNLVYAFLIVLIIVTPVIDNSLEVMSNQSGGKILSVNIKTTSQDATQLSVIISLWSGGYFWRVLDKASIHIMNTNKPEYIWNSLYRWSGTKIISANFFIELDVPHGSLLVITLKMYFHNCFGARWIEEVSTSIPAR
ncbi:MAG: signal peptidase I [Candidatus Heimdallarchaeota archaeon]